MGKLQDGYAAETQIEQTQTNEFDGKVWHTPTLTTWEVPEVTESSISGEPPG
jgi:hypothetical protein